LKLNSSAPRLLRFLTPSSPFFYVRISDLIFIQHYVVLAGLESALVGALSLLECSDGFLPDGNHSAIYMAYQKDMPHVLAHIRKNTVILKNRLVSPFRRLFLLRQIFRNPRPPMARSF